MPTVKRKCKVVMIPTEKANSTLKGYLGSLLFIYQKEYKTIDAEKGFTGYYHLYILSDDEIKVGDWVIMLDSFENVFSNPQQYTDQKTQHLNKGLRKIISTTDESIRVKDLNHPDVLPDWNLPKPSQAFIQKFVDAYNSGNPITEAMVEYEGIEWLDRPLEYFPKINLKDNTITITKVKDSWTKEEVKEFAYHILGHFVAKHDIYIDGQEISEYLKQNL